MRESHQRSVVSQEENDTVTQSASEHGASSQTDISQVLTHLRPGHPHGRRQGETDVGERVGEWEPGEAPGQHLQRLGHWMSEGMKIELSHHYLPVHGLFINQ